MRKDYGLSQKQISEIIKHYQESYIIEKLELVQSSNSYKKGKIKNLGKYLLCALDDDYQPQKAASEILPKLNNKDVIEYEKYLRKKIPNLFSEVDEGIKRNLLEKFEEYIKNTAFNSLYKREQLNNVLVQDQFIKFIMGHDNELKREILPLNKWLL